MATSININFDGFGFLDDSDDCTTVDVSKLSPTNILKQQAPPPISPIESESSSGISSLDSDDLKKQLLSSPPTISISHDDDDDEEEEEDDRESSSGSAEKEQTDSGADGDDEELDSSERESVESYNDDDDDDNNESNNKEKGQPQKSDYQLLDIQEITDSGKDIRVTRSPLPSSAKSHTQAAIVSTTPDPPAPPIQVMYNDQNILNLGANIGVSREFVKHTVLPENNIACFFQNRAQYWRLGNGDVKEMPDAITKCSCCDFMFPSINNNLLSQQGLASGRNKNSITDSLLTFLKNHHADYNNFNPMPNSINLNNSNNSSAHNSNNNIINANNTGGNVKRMYNNNAPYIAYQMIQQQQSMTASFNQQAASNANGYYATGMNGWNSQMPPSSMPPQQQQQMNLFGNVCGSNSAAAAATPCYNGTALAIMNLMNPSQRNPAFQAMNNNTPSRYYNNMNTTNNGFGLYKQF